jgi:hypothetical protein
MSTRDPRHSPNPDPDPDPNPSPNSDSDPNSELHQILYLPGGEFDAVRGWGEEGRG